MLPAGIVASWPLITVDPLQLGEWLLGLHISRCLPAKPKGSRNTALERRCYTGCWDGVPPGRPLPYYLHPTAHTHTIQEFSF